MTAEKKGILANFYFYFYSKNGKTNVGRPAIQIKKLLSPYGPKIGVPVRSS
jgi:hypothetical protein